MGEFSDNDADVHKGMVFLKGFAQVSFTWSKIHKRLTLAYSASNPMIMYVNGFGGSLFHCIIDK